MAAVVRVFFFAQTGMECERQPDTDRADITDRDRLKAGLRTEKGEGMKTTTLTAMRAIYESDPARTRADRESLLKTLGLAEGCSAARQAEKLIGFEEAARRLNRTPRAVHLLARRGVLRKAKLPGGIRAAGVLASDLDALLANMVEGGEVRECGSSVVS